MLGRELPGRARHQDQDGITTPGRSEGTDLGRTRMGWRRGGVEGSADTGADARLEGKRWDVWGLQCGFPRGSPHVVDLLWSQVCRTKTQEKVHRVHKRGRGLGWELGRESEGMRRDGGGIVKGWCPGTGCPDTKRYKESRYSLKLIGVVGGVGVDVLRHGGNRPLMHGLTGRQKDKKAVSDFCKCKCTAWMASCPTRK